MAREAGHSRLGVDEATERTGKRNIERFPDDFMFQLNPKELNVWRSQIATSSSSQEGPSLSASRLHGAGSTTDASCA